MKNYALTEQSTTHNQEKSQTVSKQGMMQELAISKQTETVLLNNDKTGRRTDVATCLMARDYKGFGKLQLGNGVVEWKE